jgi:hypothetical protein
MGSGGLHFATNEKARSYYWTYCECNPWNEQKLTGANTKSTALPERGIPSVEPVRCCLRHNSNTDGNQPALPCDLPHLRLRKTARTSAAKCAVRTQLHYAVHNDLVARVTDMYYSTVDRVLHKVLTIRFLRLSQTSI